MNVRQFLDALRAEWATQPEEPARPGRGTPRSPRLLTLRELPARPARYAQPAQPLPPSLAQALAQQGVSQLYVHQARSLDLARAGHNVVVVTGTASGKSLCYNLPVLEDLLSHPNHRALYLFPTKALAQDQLRSLEQLAQKLAGIRLRAGTYDGDTPVAARRRLRAEGQIILTNPDMLHAGILPNHGVWSHFLGQLRWVVIDEIHTYRGVFGSNVALVLRRLARLVRIHNPQAKLQFLAASATVANAGELASALVGSPFTVVDEDGSPRGPRTFVLWNPPVVSQGEIRRSSVLEARDLVVRLMEQQVTSIVFSRTRGGAELLYRYVQEELLRQAPRLANRIRAYRGGYLPQERRQVEQQLFSGELLAVSSTNALELGIDVGGLDASVLVGYPGSIASTWQQAGRAGRGQEPSLSVLIAGPGPIDQYLCRHPDYFFGRSPEHAVIDPGNPYVCLNHLRAALAETVLVPEELTLFGRYAPSLLQLLEEQGEVIRVGGQARWQGHPHPASQFGLRTLDDVTYTVLDKEPGAPPQVLGTTDEVSAFLELHPQAVYLHNGESYLVDRLDTEQHVAHVHKEELEYYTQAVAERRVRVERVEASQEKSEATAGFGAVDIFFAPYMFKKIRFSTRENVGYGLIQGLPTRTLHTLGVWLAPGQQARRLVEAAGLSAAEGLLGLANTLAEVVPLYAMCDPADVGTTVDTGAAGLPAVYVYDRYPGGLGFSERVYRLLDQVLASCLDLIQGCPCADGCPSCVGAPIAFPGGGGGNGTAGLVPNKQAALLLLAAMLQQPLAGPLAARLDEAKARLAQESAPAPVQNMGSPAAALAAVETAATSAMATSPENVLASGSSSAAATGGAATDVDRGQTDVMVASGPAPAAAARWPAVEVPLTPALEQRLRQKLARLREGIPQDRPAWERRPAPTPGGSRTLTRRGRGDQSYGAEQDQ
ncbi:MAG: DEAD/DEAH box helicase [Limnochordaceae bacterium]|nr:DEAD/DEAH box helicase [Limnochordaceae bacterium]